MKRHFLVAAMAVSTLVTSIGCNTSYHSYEHAVRKAVKDRSAIVLSSPVALHLAMPGAVVRLDKKTNSFHPDRDTPMPDIDRAAPTIEKITLSDRDAIALSLELPNTGNGGSSTTQPTTAPATQPTTAKSGFGNVATVGQYVLSGEGSLKYTTGIKLVMGQVSVQTQGIDHWLTLNDPSFQRYIHELKDDEWIVETAWVAENVSFELTGSSDILVKVQSEFNSKYLPGMSTNWTHDGALSVNVSGSGVVAIKVFDKAAVTNRAPARLRVTGEAHFSLENGNNGARLSAGNFKVALNVTCHFKSGAKPKTLRAGPTDLPGVPADYSWQANGPIDLTVDLVADHVNPDDVDYIEVTPTMQVNSGQRKASDSKLYSIRETALPLQTISVVSREGWIANIPSTSAREDSVVRSLTDLAIKPQW